MEVFQCFKKVQGSRSKEKDEGPARGAEKKKVDANG